MLLIDGTVVAAAASQALTGINIMKRSLSLISLFLLCVPFTEAQSNSVKFNTRVQLSTGGLFTRARDPEREFTINYPEYYGLQQSLQISFCVPVKVFNFGLGTGVSFRTGDYFSTICPKVFALIEIGNATKRSLFSFSFFSGLMQGWVQKKACFYFGGGPSFNFCKIFHPISFSISPYFEFHWGETKNITFWDSVHGEYQTYTYKYRTFTGNLSCIIQFNNFKKK